MHHTLSHSLLIILKAFLIGIVKIPVFLVAAVIGYYIWQQYPVPWSVVIGLPLMLLGISMGVLSIYELVVAIISPQWRRQHCPYCRPIEKVSDILSTHDGFSKR
jgi:uncharacterized membrane protein